MVVYLFRTIESNATRMRVTIFICHGTDYTAPAPTTST